FDQAPQNRFNRLVRSRWRHDLELTLQKRDARRGGIATHLEHPLVVRPGRAVQDDDLVLDRYTVAYEIFGPHRLHPSAPDEVRPCHQRPTLASSRSGGPFRRVAVSLVTWRGHYSIRHRLAMPRSRKLRDAGPEWPRLGGFR